MSNWVHVFQQLGVTTAVLTAKHGCGFLAWHTKTKLPDGREYPYHVSDEQATAQKFVAATTAAGIGQAFNTAHTNLPLRPTPPPLPPPPAFSGHGFYYSLTNNFFLNARGHVVQPPSTLLPRQASVTQQQYEDLAIAQVVFLIFTPPNPQYLG